MTAVNAELRKRLVVPQVPRWKRVLMGVWAVALLAILIHNIVRYGIFPYAMEFFGIYLPKHAEAFIEVYAVFLTVTLLGNAIAKRFPRPFRWSLVTLYHLLRLRVRGERRALREDEEFGGSNANLIALRFPYVRMVFFVLLLINVPFLATMEELWFRNGHTDVFAILLFSLFFGFIHCAAGVPLVVGTVLTPVGAWLALHYVGGGLSEAVLYHVAFNTLGMVVLLAEGIIAPDIREWLRKRKR
jgi:hypothetical protein